MYVVKKPKRSDFCGCPPCPLCYDWVDDIEAKKPEEERKVVPGIIAMGMQLMGKQELTRPEIALMEEAGDRIHVANLARPKQQEEEFQAAVELRQLEVFLETAEASKPKKVPVKPRNKTLDDMTPAELEAACAPKKKTYNPVIDDMYEPADLSQSVLEQKAIWEDKIRREKKRQQEAVARAKAAYYMDLQTRR